MGSMWHAGVDRGVLLAQRAVRRMILQQLLSGDGTIRGQEQK